jgi:hypothetical protein
MNPAGFQVDVIGDPRGRDQRAIMPFLGASARGQVCGVVEIPYGY